MAGGAAERKAASLFIIVKIVAAACFGVALVGASTLPFAPVKARVDAMAADGVAEDFTAQDFARIAANLRAAGVAILVIAVLMIVARRPLRRWLEGLLGSFADLWRDASEAWRSAAAADGLLHVCALCATVAIAAAVRLYFINGPIRYDEAHSFMYYASRPLYVTLSNYSSVNNHIFHNILVHAAYSLLGDKEWAIRLPSFLAGVILVPAAYLAARMLYNKEAALLAAALVSSSSALVEFSTNARGYTMICVSFMLLLSLGAYLRGRGSAAGWWLFAVISALGFYTIPVMLYPFGIVCAWLLLSALLKDVAEAPRHFVRTLVISGLFAAAVTLLLYTPVLIGSGFNSVFGIPSLAAHASGGWEGFTGGMGLRLKAFWSQWNRDLPLAVSVALVAGFAVSTILHRRTANHKVPVLLAAVLWCVPVLIVMRALPWPRVWLYLLPLYFIIAAAGLCYVVGLLARAVRLRASAACAVLALAISAGVGANVAHTRSVYYSEETGTLRDAERVAVTLGRELKPGDKLLAYSPAGAPLLFYFKKHEVPIGPLVSEDRDSWRRVFVVVDTPRHNLKWVLAKTHFDTRLYGPPELVEDTRFVEIYLYERK
jgi:4-amino-4-deoxy-L-arabinose transferase-like glycosyltransferase